MAPSFLDAPDAILHLTETALQDIGIEGSPGLILQAPVEEGGSVLREILHYDGCTANLITASVDFSVQRRHLGRK